MPLRSTDIPSFVINYVCSCLLISKIRTTHDLNQNFYSLIAQISQNPNVFKESYSVEDCYLILEQAVKAYNNANDFVIRISNVHKYAFSDAEQQTHLFTVVPIKTDDDLSRVTQNYDRLVASHKQKKQTNKFLLNIFAEQPYIETTHVILGSGDTGTALWLEKYAQYHEVALPLLAEGTVPPIVMIANNSGNWGHNYTLAQPHNILERAPSPANPSDYVSTKYYRSNPYTNGRHVYQANQVILAETKAPLMQAVVLKIEKQEHHPVDWETDHPYRLIVETTLGIRRVYCKEVDICTGLGPAKSVVPSTLVETSKFLQLTKYDKNKGFIPIMDGNQFILTDAEERSTVHRTIVIYGGGGTAAACYRKGFFGHDVGTESLPFEDSRQKNKVLWVAKQFDKAGTGKLVTHALKSARERNELVYAELTQVTPMLDGTFLLFFKTTGDSDSETLQIACDQFIYSIGQNDVLMRQICMEVESDLSLNFDKAMVLNVQSADKNIRFFGAAAMAVREREYMTATWSWLRSQNIGGDVGPGSMPPSRAQIKRYNALNGIIPASINANMDSTDLIIDYLQKAGVTLSIAQAFTDDLLFVRKQSTSGANHATLFALLKKHNLTDHLEIQGHGHLNTKAVPLPKPNHSLLSWLQPLRETEDAALFVSTAIENNPQNADSMLTSDTELVTIKVTT